MAASITHRATGVALYSGTLLLAAWAFAASRGEEFYRPFGAFLASPAGVFVLFGYTWSLLFHSINGLRHLYWDMGRGLDVKQARTTAWCAYAASLLLAIIIVASALSPRA